MHQALSTPPTPPVPPQDPTSRGDLGSVINNVVKNTLQSVSTELSKELSRSVARREALQGQLDGATSASQRASLRRQIATADEEVAKLQAGIDKLNAKTSTHVGVQYIPPIPPMNDIVPTTMIISVVAIIFVGFPLAIAFARLLWKRANQPLGSAASQLPADSTRRFDHLEQAIDAIAIEVERISENQRYLTKLLSEPKQAVSVGAGEVKH
jgi:hypothetical protein